MQVNNNLFEIYVDLEKFRCGNCSLLGEAAGLCDVMDGLFDEVIMWR